MCGFKLGQKLQSCMRTKRLLRQSYILHFRHYNPTIYLYHYFFFIIALDPSMELKTSKQVKMTCNAENIVVDVTGPTWDVREGKLN